ncbi:MAG TPA: hypothetical protein VFW68_13040 [Rhodocyclaceae bacterium]|nr:hypothetical protein [Rhodocyclaceae bacterium]
MKLLRLSVFFLILANLILFAWGQGYLGARDTGREPERLEEQKSPEKLKVVASGSDESATAPAAVEADSGNSECRRAVGFAPADVKTWITAAQEKLPKAKLNLLPGVASFDVAIVGLRAGAAAEAKQKELRDLGIDGASRLIKEGPERVSLLFNSFATEAEAKAYLLGLNGKGVRTARVVAHPAAASAQVEVVGADAAQLKELLAGRDDNVRIEECPAH